MHSRPWSVARLMAEIAILAVGLAAVLALLPRQGLSEAGLTAFGMALILTAATDRALFGHRRRAFWIGFALMGWLCTAAALTYHQESRRYLLKHGPPLVRARDDLREQRAATALQRAAAAQAHIQWIEWATPRVSEWYLLASLLAEAGLGLTAWALAASAGGLFGAGVAALARQSSRLARRLSLPDPTLHRSPPAAARALHDEGVPDG